jgi:RNA-directed DNA polymerase
MGPSPVYQGTIGITMLLTDRNFNTSFFEPALRHSSFNNQLININKSAILNEFNIIYVYGLLINRHVININIKTYIVTKIRELSGGALINESEFLGPVNNGIIRLNLIITCFLSSVVSVRLAEAKNCIKTGSTNGLPNKLSFRAREHKEKDKLFAGGYLDDFSISIPEQVRSYNLIQEINSKYKWGYYLSVVETYNGNPVKSVTGSNNVSYTIERYIIMEDSKRIIFSKLYNLSRTFEIQVNKQVFLNRSGGKIIEKANVESNVSNNEIRSLIYYKKIGNNSSGINKVMQNRLRTKQPVKAHLLKIPQGIFNKQNSILLNEANKLTKSVQYRTFVTDVLHRQPGSPGTFPSEWSRIKWRDIGAAVYAKQVVLVKLAGKYGPKNPKITRTQIRCCKSLEFRLWAVYKTSLNKGSTTPGIDGQLLLTGVDKLNMVENMKRILIDADKKKFKRIPVKRVYIPKANGKLRPLGIPSIRDRCLQQLIGLILEPLVDMNSDPHSFGFRKYRNAKNAVASVRTILQSGLENKWVLDADIKSFFDDIDHEWLLQNIPLNKTLKYILNNWLTSGVILKEEGKFRYEETESGTPQGGIISPILANFVLNGLEKTVKDSISSITGGKDFRKNIYKNGKRTKLLSFKIKTVRYADDFVIIATSRRVIEKYIKPAVIRFLEERGLKLSQEKSKVFKIISGEELNFLGYTFKYRKNWSLKYSFFKDRLGKSGIALYPNKQKVKEVIKKLKIICNKNYNSSAYELISILNPIIRGWSSYFNMGESSTYRGYIRYALYLYTWRWAHKKHPKWGKKRIAKTYFLSHNTVDSKSKRNKWIFSGITWNNSRYSDTEEGKTRSLLDPNTVVETVSGRTLNIPDKLLGVHAYHDNISELIKFQTKSNFLSLGKDQGIKGKLIKKQNGMCELCGKSLMYYPDGTNMINLNYEIDHIIPISAKGSKQSIDNMRLLHSWCHKEVTYSQYGKSY